MLEMSAGMQAAMVAHAIAGLPDEACGLFAGLPGSNRVERFFPMRNAAESREIYVLDGLEMMDVERTADDAGLTVMGVMHSHTHTTNYPSPTDIADAARFDPFGAWRFVIVSLRHPEPSLRSFRILDGGVAEEPVVVGGGVEECGGVVEEPVVVGGGVVEESVVVGGGVVEESVVVGGGVVEESVVVDGSS